MKTRLHKWLSMLVVLAMLIAVFPVNTIAANSLTGIYDLRVNDLVAPMGIDDPTPTFSWKMESDAIGAKQTAYQIIVAADKKLSDKVWDSGKVDSGFSVGISYEGPALEASTTYYWQVTVWDQDNQNTQSEVSSFEMGLLGTEAWNASKWIQLGTGKTDTQEVELNYVLEADIQVINAAVGLVFEAADKDNYLMWQIVKKDNALFLKPHYKVDGTYTELDEIDITDKVSDINGMNHLKIEIKDEAVKTFVGEACVSTLQKSELGGIGWKGGIGSVGYRTDYYFEEDGYLDNIKLTDYLSDPAGEVKKDYSFDTSNPFDGGTVTDGKLSTKFIANQGDVVYGDFFLSNGSSGGLPTFRKTIQLDQPISSAKLYVTALGVFDVFINGERVGHQQSDGTVIYDELKPGYTQPEKRVSYYTYDVTNMLDTSAANAISANVSTGWWNGDVATRLNMTNDKTNAFRAQLLLTYADGSNAVIGTDETWKTALQGPVMEGDIFAGETYDATADTSYREADYDDSGWNDAELHSEFNGEITAHMGPTVRVRDDLTLNAKSITVYNGVTGADENQYGKVNVISTYQDGESFTLNPGETAVVDLGQNFAGWEKLELEGPKGSMVTMRHGEMLNDNNGLKSRKNDGPEGSIYTVSLQRAESTGRYILNGNGREVYQASHTFYGFRYLEITANAAVTIHNVQGMVVTSVAENTGKITTGNADVNQLFQNILWGQYSNYLAIPTDCPQRDERQGWTADTHVFSTAACFNADSKGFLTKWMQDMRDSQNKGEFYGAYPNTAPATRHTGEGEIGWADAGIIVPYNLYKMYGDRSIIEDNYASMQEYMDIYMAGRGPDGGKTMWGDWLAYEDYDNIRTLLGVAYYAWDAKMMSEMASVLGKTEDAERYQKLYESEKAYFQQQFVNSDGTLNRTQQTACLYALYLDLLPDENSRQAVKQMLLDNIASHGDKLQTGFLGTAIMMQTLSKVDADDVAYTLLLQREAPSWLFAVEQGATTVWERWNLYGKDTGFYDNSSFNHYAYGAVAQWMYEYMAGILSDFENPGFKHFILQPTPNEEIGYVNCSYESEYGTIESNWNYTDGKLHYSVTIPANTTATIYLPVDAAEGWSVNGKHCDQLTSADGILYDSSASSDGVMKFEAAAGAYTFAPSAENCTVTFDTSGGSTIADVTVVAGTTVSKPDDPTKDGYTFVGWYSDAQFQNEYDFSTPVNSNITLYAKWEENSTEQPVCSADAAIRSTAQRDQNDRAVFHLNLKDAKNIAAVQVTFDNLGDAEIIGASEFTTVGTKDNTVVLSYLHDGVRFSCEGEATVATIAVPGNAPSVKITEVKIASYDVNGEPAFGEAVDLLVTEAAYTGFDLTGDQQVDLRDIVAAMKWYRVDPTEPKAVQADVDGDGDVDVQDLIAILLHYTA